MSDLFEFVETSKVSWSIRFRTKIESWVRIFSEWFRSKIFRFLFNRKNSNLVKHAEYEMKLAGLDNKGSDYDGMLFDCVLDLIRLFSSQGHSGFSAMRVRELFSILSNYELLLPLTKNRDEWMVVEEKKGKIVLQSRRNPACFSSDNLKTYYNINDEKGTKIKFKK